MKASENNIKWLMRLYPPMLFQRIWVQKIHKGFRGADIKINHSLFTINFGKAIFGGTIFSATDPFYAILFGQILKHKGYNITVWLKSASIQYIKPGRTNLFYSIKITDEMINEVETELNNNGVIVKTYTIEVFSKTGELCAVAKNEIYIRKK
jgi:acyl-coenzyme A thioesterase PaaI-like protein